MEFLKIEIFFEVKSKYPSLFERKNYPLSNIFINNLLKNFKIFSGVYSKDQIPLIKNIFINILYLIYKIAIDQDRIGLDYLEKMIIFSYLIVLVLAIFQIIYIKFTKIII